MRFLRTSVQNCLLFLIGVAAVYSTSPLTAQQTAGTHPTRPATAAQSVSEAAKPQITPEQKLGLRLLKSAEDETPNLQPDMRAFVLWQASHGYRSISPAKADSLLNEALGATLSIDKGPDKCIHGEAELCGTRYWLQKAILEDVITRAKRVDEIESLLARVEPEVRQIVTPDLFRLCVHEKAFTKAYELLRKMGSESGHFSYGSATELIEALPSERSEDRLVIFSEAMEAYSHHTEEKFPAPDDPTIMVLRLWRQLPPPTVLDAINQILDRAKHADEGAQQNTRVGISAIGGSTYFSSVYQFRVYELAPVLEQLDSGWADSLLNDSPQVQDALKRYSQGLLSMNAFPDPNGASTSHVPGILSMGAEDAADQARNEVLRRENRILNEAAKDPRQALEDAMALPSATGAGTEYGPRAAALAALARTTAGRNPAISRAALEEIRKSAANLPPRNQVAMLGELPELYLRLGQEDEARNSLNELLKIAKKLYERDSDLNDPNQAFKGMWPSTHLWRECFAFAAKLTPSPAEDIMQDIPDFEIKMIERITYANALLGADTLTLSIVEKHKNGIRASIGL